MKESNVGLGSAGGGGGGRRKSGNSSPLGLQARDQLLVSKYWRRQALCK